MRKAVICVILAVFTVLSGTFDLDKGKYVAATDIPDNEYYRCAWGLIGVQKVLYDSEVSYSKKEWNVIVDSLTSIADSIADAYDYSNRQLSIDWYGEPGGGFATFLFENPEDSTNSELIKTEGWSVIVRDSLDSEHFAVFVIPDKYYGSPNDLYALMREWGPRAIKYTRMKKRVMKNSKDILNSRFTTKVTNYAGVTDQVTQETLFNLYHPKSDSLNSEKICKHLLGFVIDLAYKYGVVLDERFNIAITYGEDIAAISPVARRWMSGLHDGRDLFVRSSARDWRITLDVARHESVHELQRIILGNGFRGVNKLVLEGHANFEEENCGFDTIRVRNLLNSGDYISLKELWAQTPMTLKSQFDLGRFYAMSNAWVSFVVDKYGFGKWKAYWHVLGKARASRTIAEDTFYEVYGESVFSQQKEFNDYLVNIIKERFGEETAKRAEHFANRVL